MPPASRDQQQHGSSKQPGVQKGTETQLFISLLRALLCRNPSVKTSAKEGAVQLEDAPLHLDLLLPSCPPLE